MENEKLQKMEVFLLLVHRQAEKFRIAEEESNQETSVFVALANQLSSAEVSEFESLRNSFEEKTAEEKQEWRQKVENFIGKDDLQIDENIHWSHVEAALQKETLQMRRILVSAFPPEYRGRTELRQTELENKNDNLKSSRVQSLEKHVRATFIRQFPSLRELNSASKFDRLSGAELARLIRLAGIREVALACVRIEAVESVAAFLRRFAPEDARAIASQLSGLAIIPAERLSFAEDLVHDALESEPNPSAMLDLLGFKLLGILLCDASAAQITYAEQKLPLDITPKVSEVIETQRCQTPDILRRDIAREIQKLAVTVMETSGGIIS